MTRCANRIPLRRLGDRGARDSPFYCGDPYHLPPHSIGCRVKSMSFDLLKSRVEEGRGEEEIDRLGCSCLEMETQSLSPSLTLQCEDLKRLS